MKPWGFHYILNLQRCNANAIRNKQKIERFADVLVKRIDMVPFGRPQIQHFGYDNKAGFTLVQLIETSNICAHFVEFDNSAYIDVFSCKDFQTSDIDQTVHEFFKPHKIQSILLTRDASGSSFLR
jgi:S-adenosylmethionine/arginine decarboxylase-like enzyme